MSEFAPTSAAHMHDLAALRFNNRYARLPEHFFTRVTPEPRQGTRLADVSPDCARLLGLEAPLTSDASNEEALEQLRLLMAGEQLLPGMDALAQKYTGHQFGHYNPQLGDGRGILLGELEADYGKTFDLHLKGAGRTPYSRFGDGQAVVRSSVREYLASEYMAALGIPTSRALALAVNGERVQRETVEPGATVLRVCESHLRFGHFEWLAHSGRHEDLKTLIDHALREHFPESLPEMPDEASDMGEIGREPLDEATRIAAALAMFEIVITRTAKLIAAWQAYGFVHAVMNTDNMSLLGLTFDYGPYAFLDGYEENLVPNHTDQAGRYGFAQQPGIGLWNLERLGIALSPLIDVEALSAALGAYEGELQREYARLMRARLGLPDARDEDMTLVQQWRELLAAGKVDHTHAYRLLSHWDVTQPVPETLVVRLAGERGPHGNSAQARDEASAWLERYQARVMVIGLSAENERQRRLAMLGCNPLYVPRTHLLLEVIARVEQGDDATLKALRQRLTAPFFRPEEGSLEAAQELGQAQGVDAELVDDWTRPPAANAAPICMSCSS
ncbi:MULTISPECIES: protein adenylyltransferase SelO [Cobetia]|uniref:protein adenylyltransferase SelO n=1 Tax=Cobetia TaxID=204286 RepID=UPI00158399FF|nr:MULTISPECIES: YdiU family protein [Cobetia]MDI4660614.1 YdiU family protein [Cobetia sp. BMC6]MDL2190107.1 YdiU family protein [Cobetia sp. LC6]NUJ54752.1 YdiU family protein [Cobetia marina]